MAITLLFEPKAGADAQYDSVINTLKDQGTWPPEGLTYHVASGTGADFKVSRCGNPSSTRGTSASA